MGNNETPMLELVDVHKSFGDVKVLKGISASISKGELLTFVGPSGCGKTTLLRIIGGFTPITSGKIILDGEDIADLPPNMRNTKMVFQSYALFPHMNVRKNIGFGLKIQKLPQQKIDDRVDKLLSLVHLDGLGDRTIDRISGGQQQRVALARSLALEPKVLLLDEPLSNLDANLRVVMRDEIRNIQERIGITTIFVTHDQYEAMSISDRLLVLNDGVIQQIGTPSDIYETPDNRFIAEFVGYVNFLEGKIKGFDQDSGIFHVSTEYGDISLNKINEKNFDKGDEVFLVIRPETVTLFPWDAPDLPNMLTGQIRHSMYSGNLVKYTILCGDRELLIDQYNPKDSIRFKRGDNIKFTVPRTVHALPKNDMNV